MDHQEMLKKVGLTENQFCDLLQKHADFMKSLDPAQQAAIRRSARSLAQAAASFGPGATVEDLRRLVERCKLCDGTSFFCSIECSNPE